MALQYELLPPPASTRPAGRPLTLREAQEDYHSELDAHGVAECLCCGHKTRRYRRAFNSGMAATLCWLVREYMRTHDWVAVQARAPRHVLRSNEIGKLAAWGMAEQRPPDNGSKRTSGVWRPTLLGETFAVNGEYIHSHAVFCNGKIESFDGELIDIHTALGKRFNYSELMGESV